MNGSLNPSSCSLAFFVLRPSIFAAAGIKGLLEP